MSNRQRGKRFAKDDIRGPIVNWEALCGHTMSNSQNLVHYRYYEQSHLQQQQQQQQQQTQISSLHISRYLSPYPEGPRGTTDDLITRTGLRDNVPDRPSAKVAPVWCQLATTVLKIQTVPIPKGGLHSRRCHPTCDVSACT